MQPSEFWDSTEWETDAMAVEHLRARENAHRQTSWFVAHLIAPWCGKKTSMRQLLDMLNAPVAADTGRIVIRSRQDALNFERDYGVKLLNNAT